MSIEQLDIIRWANSYDGPPFHALITDPPYGYKYNQQKWDNEIALQPETWQKLSAHLLPGAFGVAFSAARLYHRLATAVEDAGFRIHPFILNWHQAQSMPRATKADSNHYYGGQVLRSSIEPILLFQKPAKHPLPTFEATGAGCLHIPCNETWPTNVMVQHETTCTLFECAPNCLTLHDASRHMNPIGWEAEEWEDTTSPITSIPKASRFERDFLLSHLPDTEFKRVNDGGLAKDPRFAPIQTKNFHPTVKPLALACWLGKLLLPPETHAPRRLLNPFTGSGTEAIGAFLSGWEEVTGIELNPEYHALATERFKAWENLANQHTKRRVCLAIQQRDLKSLTNPNPQTELFDDI